ncbi:MAG TPA: M23 family metallopeptidase [Acidimicrobiia bacterium]|jgi:murein DD-endopeptidase MepM/ murein hydrolase activator NlpD
MRALPRHLSVLLALASLLLTAAARPPAASLTVHIEDVTVQAGRVSELALVFPQAPEVTHFDDTWGDARSGGRRHKGTDLMAPKLSPVYAVADGVVTLMRKSGLAGYWVGIEHAGGIETWYMHLNNDTPGTDNGRASLDEVYAPGIELGAFVSAGQLIGYVGDSGNAEHSGSHTHFELRVDGVAVDPYPLLRAAHERAMEVVRIERVSALLDLVD